MSEPKMPSYGGQAVIEGVMMRGSGAVAIAMRAPDGQVVVHTETLSGIYKSKAARIPFLRGVVVLWDALGLGIRALTISANTQTEEEQKLEGSGALPDAGRLAAAGHSAVLPAAGRAGTARRAHLWDQCLVGQPGGRGPAPVDAHRLHLGGRAHPGRAPRVCLPRRRAQDHQCLRGRRRADPRGRGDLPAGAPRAAARPLSCPGLVVSVLVFSLLGPTPMCCATGEPYCPAAGASRLWPTSTSG